MTPIGSQRAFVGKKSKMTAADVRRHIMTGSLLLNHPTSVEMTTTDSGSTCLTLLEVADPIDIEEQLSQRKSSALYDISSSIASPRKVCEFPADDVEVRVVSRESPTVDSPVDIDVNNPCIDSHVRDVMTSLNDSFSLVQRRYQQFGSGDAFVRMLIERPIVARSAPRHVYEGDTSRVNDRVGRSASIVEGEESKRNSYTSTASSSTMGSAEGLSSEPRLHHSQPDPTVPGVIQRISYQQVVQINESKRQSGRQNILVNLLPTQNENEVIEKRSAPPYPEEKNGQKLIVKVVKLHMDPCFEPIFGSMAIYDAKARRKVTENFYFDMNPDNICALLDSKIQTTESMQFGTTDDALEKCQQAAFNLSGPLHDLYVVVRLEKVLQACEVSEAAEPYVSIMRDERSREKLTQTASDFCERLGQFRMPLGFLVIDVWRTLCDREGLNSFERSDMMSASTLTNRSTCTAGDMAPLVTMTGDTDSIVSADRISVSTTSTFRRIGSGTSASTVLNRVRTPLARRKFIGGSMDEDRSECIPPRAEPNLTNLQPFHRTYSHFFRQEADKMSEEDLIKLLSEARKSGGKLSKLKLFPAVLTLQFSGGNGEELLTRLNPEMLRVAPFMADRGAELTKDIQEFPAMGHYAVNASYRNLLYIYPRSMNLSARPGTARNISIKIQLLNGREQPQLVFFSKGADVRMDSSVYTTVIYHNKNPQLCDEIKMKIPVDLDDGHHLLFTFYHISCKPNSKEEEVEYPIGYTWLPLFKNGSLECGEFNLPISLDKLPTSYGYLSPDVALPNIKWLEQHKALFSITLRAVTSVHTQDDHLERFLSAVNSLSSVDRKKPPVNEMQLTTAIQGVIKARPEPMVSFLYNILNKLLALIANSPYSDTVSATCFETLGQLVKICTMLLDSFCDSHGRSSLLTTYIHYFKIALKESRTHSVLCKELADAAKTKPGSPETQKLFHIIEDMEKSVGSRKASQPQPQDAPSPPSTTNRAIHEELIDLWVRSSGAAREMAFLNSWFFLELLIKSMAEYLSMTGRLYLARKSRFGERFTRSVDALSNAISNEVIGRLTKDHRQAAALANSWAFFLRDAFSLMDRSYVMGLVKNFNKVVASKINVCGEPVATTLMFLKLDFVRIISSHEHFVVLNMPYGGVVTTMAPPPIPSSSSAGSVASGSNLQPPSPGGSSLGSRSSNTTDSFCSLGSIELTAEFRGRHFLIGLVLADLAVVLETSSNATLHARAIGVIRNLLAAHEADSRLTDSGVRARVANLYLPLVAIVLDVATQLHDPYARGGGHGSHSRFSEPDLDGKPGVNPRVALAIAGIGSASPPRTPVDSAKTARNTIKTPLKVELSRQLLACFCWVLKNMDRPSLRAWMRELSPSRLSQLLDVLQLCVSCFEYKAGNQVDEDSMPGLLHEDASDLCVGSKYGVKMRDKTIRRSMVRRSDSIQGPDDEWILEAVLCAEVTLCVLDTLEMIIQVVGMTGSDHLLFVLPIILREFMHLLACNQSVQALDCIFASQRALVVKYPELVFEQETEQCGELCLQLLRHCASRLPAIRSQAAASLYLLMRESYESGGSLARVKMQITMSLSTLVSNGTRIGLWLNENCLRKSLKTVLMYAETDANTNEYTRVNTSFSEQVKDLVFNLHMILSDTVKMKEYANDFHMTMDLMYRVAKGYQNNPDLRLTWLLNMASRHADKDLYCEAGLCMLHAAALAAEYLAMTAIEDYLPRGAVEFQDLSDNILEESAVSDDVVSPEVEGICESRHFTEGGLVHLVEKGAHFLEKAQMYEALPDVYKVIEPILCEWRDYPRLSSLHAKLSECLARIEPGVQVVEDISDAWSSPLRSSDKRCFGTYFRVGFYGSRFGDLDSEEFVYKEPPFTKLSEISSRLESFYADRFGVGVVEVIKDSNNVVRTSHTVSKAYLQITYVEPFLDKWERKRRPTHYERSHNLKRFVFATPFTREGRAHGDLKDQYKRRTIITVQHSFPYVKTRVRVVDREQRVLTPIEVAIEDIEKKTRELAAATCQSPPDAKMLQMVLQGCIGTTVNQGPIQVANVFLTDIALDERGKPIDKLQNKLRLCFRDFSKKCADALALNKLLIQQDQQAYQNELQKNYVDFTRKMAPIMGGMLNLKSSIKQKDTVRMAETEQALAVAAELGPVTSV